jgi:glycosyltransferase involved in cell wall biosynthesis
MKRFLAITPARDEQLLLPGLIASMVAQTRRPDRWVVIDDGSADRTAQLLDEAAREYDWIEVHHLPRNRKREPGGESVIMKFLTREVWGSYDFILRTDADLTFEPRLIELLLAEFDRDPGLGIAGAVLHEPHGSGWREVRGPRFHTRGAVKLYSSKCFAAIGGLQAGIGWDTIDEAHAMMLGYRTSSFPQIIAFHHRPQGAAGGMLRSRFSTGRTAYVIGYSPVFMLARAFRRMLVSPPLVGSVMMLAGYLDARLRGMPRTASPELVRYIREQQIRRLLLMDSVWR